MNVGSHRRDEADDADGAPSEWKDVETEWVEVVWGGVEDAQRFAGEGYVGADASIEGMVGKNRAKVVDGAEAGENACSCVGTLVADAGEVLGEDGAIVRIFVKGEAPGVDESFEGGHGSGGDARVVDVNVGE